MEAIAVSIVFFSIICPLSKIATPFDVVLISQFSFGPMFVTYCSRAIFLIGGTFSELFFAVGKLSLLKMYSGILA